MNNDLSSPAAERPLTCTAESSVAPRTGPVEPVAPPEPRGCLFALSQPPLMLFLAVIGGLLLFGAVYDLYRW
ncbi:MULTISPECIES: hypothetical protein [Streptomyces]|uniref:Uncharacterized protein n=1 Tax=Streptomyces lycii TaxID=2654337 RepID=A0ABQ7FH07_9ACTN|nr:MULTISPECIES: hypothetical protein [Streptomyces]KAF4407935.1 hypothetical protein GCU69_16970 [Streptomyces lycii]PGH51392.1 hypothetical protein CRI70_07210 [Streptomyces sp. Ru87]